MRYYDHQSTASFNNQKSIVRRAVVFAKMAHHGQTRKYTGEPYFNHLQQVASIVRHMGGDDVQVAAALLHDVLEDTDISVVQLRDEFGPEITDLVIELTDVYTPSAYPSYNRKLRKQMETARLAKISPRAKLIKRADLENNTADIQRASKFNVAAARFAPVYLAEMAALKIALEE